MPAFAVRVVAVPGALVSEYVADVPMPAAEALTLYDPATEFAVKSGAIAIPFAPDVAVVDVSPPVNVPLAPVVGAENVTTTPLTGLLNSSLTVACNPIGKSVLIGVDCGVPAVAAMVKAAPAVFVNENVAGVVTPDTEADTA